MSYQPYDEATSSKIERTAYELVELLTDGWDGGLYMHVHCVTGPDGTKYKLTLVRDDEEMKERFRQQFGRTPQEKN